MESNARTTSSTAGPQHDDRSPADRLAFLVASYVRGQHIPTAAYAAGGYTRARIAAELAATSSDNERTRRDSAYDRELIDGGHDPYDRPYAHNAF